MNLVYIKKELKNSKGPIEILTNHDSLMYLASALRLINWADSDAIGGGRGDEVAVKTEVSPTTHHVGLIFYFLVVRFLKTFRGT